MTVQSFCDLFEIAAERSSLVLPVPFKRPLPLLAVGAPGPFGSGQAVVEFLEPSLEALQLALGVSHLPVELGDMAFHFEVNPIQMPVGMAKRV